MHIGRIGTFCWDGMTSQKGFKLYGTIAFFSIRLLQIFPSMQVHFFPLDANQEDGELNHVKTWGRYKYPDGPNAPQTPK